MNRLESLPENPYNALSWFVTPEGIEIGEGCWIGAFTMIDGTGGLKIGKGVTVSSGAKIVSHSGVRRCISEQKYGEIDKAAVEIGDNCFIGTNAVILMGAQLGHHSVVGAGAVVEEFSRFEPFSLIVGVPARAIGKVEIPDEKIST